MIDENMPTAKLLNVDDLARIIHKSPSSVRSDASRNPDVLPPICRLPGNKRLLWRSEDVFAWVARFVQRNPIAHPTALSSLGDLPARRGRPRKTEARA